MDRPIDIRDFNAALSGKRIDLVKLLGQPALPVRTGSAGDEENRRYRGYDDRLHDCQSAELCLRHNASVAFRRDSGGLVSGGT